MEEDMRNNRNNRRNKYKKERIIMLASAVFVLAALTMTGVFVKESSNKNKNDGYTIDFTALENSAEKKSDEIVEQKAPTDTSASNSIQKDNDMDYLPMTEVGSGDVELPEITKAAEFLEKQKTEGLKKNEKEEDTLEEEPVEQEDTSTMGKSVQTKTHPALNFKESDGLDWPIVGNVLVNYSMDKTTYFATLEQYKYSPAIVIAATKGQDIYAAANGKVVEIVEDEEIGKAVVMDLGNGYQLTYGQLDNIQVDKGSYVSTGECVGTVADPTIYYSVEGCNLYFKLTKDGVPINPMGTLK